MALTKLSASDAALLANEITPRLADAVASRIKIAMALGDDALLTSREAADFLNKSGSTLEIWRAKGFGPRWIRTGSRAVGYRIGDLKAYLRLGESVSPVAVE
jgi:hypothetical protein